MTPSGRNNAPAVEWTWFRVPMALYDRLAEVGRAACVYLVLAKHCNEAGECWPGQETIEHDAGLSGKPVRKFLRVLEAAGLIERKKRFHDSAIYFLPHIVKTGTPVPFHGESNGSFEQVKRDFSTSQTGLPGLMKRDPCPEELDPGTKPRKKSAPAAPESVPPDGLVALIRGWNDLGPTIVAKGNGARLDPPSRAVLAGWRRVERDPELRQALADVPRLLAAIGGARFCHGQGWFTLPWIFGRNKNGELNAGRLLAGCHDGDTARGGRRGLDVGRGQRHPADCHDEEGRF
ncbi:MAG: helix-turn-helix domain-containing protein [Planctomycetia bacterium]|nr:helix-turn-helix domain-containing protein [Planctomycetia bacterium]